MKFVLTFKPLKNFFFGSDRTFSEDYVAVSEYFPQNTQLLGALRLFIAEHYKLMHVHKNGKYSNEPQKLKKLIGTASSANFLENDDLGKIQNLSQMFLVPESLDDAFFPTPFDLFEKETTLGSYTLSSLDNSYFLKDYDVKNLMQQKLGNKNFWKAYIEGTTPLMEDTQPFEYTNDNTTKNESGFFIRHSQVGIALENKKTIDGAFYSKTDFQLREGYLFACLIELEDAVFSDGIIQLGAESSLFELSITPLEETKLEEHPVVSCLFQQPDLNKKLVCVSDTMLHDRDRLDELFSIVPYVKTFSMLQSDKKSFEVKSSQRKSYTKFKGKTQLKRVVPAGSLFYLNSKLPQTAQGAFKKMGFNQFITVEN